MKVNSLSRPCAVYIEDPVRFENPYKHALFDFAKTAHAADASTYLAAYRSTRKESMEALCQLLVWQDVSIWSR